MAWKKLAFTDEVLTNPMTADLDMGGNDINKTKSVSATGTTNYLLLMGGDSFPTEPSIGLYGSGYVTNPGQIVFGVADGAGGVAGVCTMEGNTTTPKVVVKHGLDMSAKDTTDSADIFPDSTANDRQLGSSAKKWGDLYAVNIDSEYLNMSGDIDLNKNDLKAACIESLASAPSSPGNAQMYYNTVDDHIHVNVV